MHCRWLAAAAITLIVFGGAASVGAQSDATLFRLFLKDGTTLVSYGEYARVGDRVVFSIPTTAAPNPPLQLVNIAAEKVDWEKTDAYGAAARADHYTRTRADEDYAQLTNDVARTLNDVALTTDPAKRLAIVQAARQTLAAWPAGHFNYRYSDVRQMLILLDEAIADLKTAAGNGRYDLALVAYTDAPITEPVLPPPTPKEAIEQILGAARIVDSPAERTTLLGAAVASIDAAKGSIPSDWASAVRASATKDLESEIAADRAYDALRQQVTSDALAHAKLADVAGVQRIEAALAARDEALGRRRPDVVSSILAEVDAQLDAARRLRLARDRWAMRLPDLRRYRVAMRDPINLFSALRPPLENIKALAGSSPAALASVHRLVGDIQRELRAITPPDELRAAHALLVSAVQMADQAAEIRRQAALGGDMARAWDASSAAAGALMLGAQARTEIQTVLHRPELR